MDPNATWALMLTAYSKSNWDEAAEHAEALQNWFRLGGFPPLTTIVSDDGTVSIKMDDVQANLAISDGVARAIWCLARAKTSGS